MNKQLSAVLGLKALQNSINTDINAEAGIKSYKPTCQIENLLSQLNAQKLAY